MLGERSGPGRGGQHLLRPLMVRAAVSSSGPARSARRRRVHKNAQSSRVKFAYRTEAGVRRHPRPPRPFKGVDVSAHEVGAVRPESGLALALETPLVLNQEDEDGFAIDDDEAAPLIVQVTDRDVMRDLREQRRVGADDVRDELRVRAGSRLRPTAVNPLASARGRDCVP